MGRRTRGARNHSDVRQNMTQEDRDAVARVLDLFRAAGADRLLEEARVYSVPQLAKLSPFTEAWIRERIDDGTLRARRFSARKLTILHRDWVAFLEAPEFDLGAA